jgi:hypothetical protein
LFAGSERKISTEKGHLVREELYWSPSNESSHAQEIIGDDESALGCKEEGIVERIDLLHVRYEQQRIAMEWNWGPPLANSE